MAPEPLFDIGKDVYFKFCGSIVKGKVVSRKYVSVLCYAYWEYVIEQEDPTASMYKYLIKSESDLW